jgi:hypothetical protein
MKNRSNFVTEVKYTEKLKAIALYTSILLLWIVSGVITGLESLIFTLGVLMSGITVVSLKMMPNDRENSLKLFKSTFGGYLLWMIMMHFVLGSVPTTESQLNVRGFLTAMYSFTTFMIPIGYIVWQAQKFRFLLGIGKSKREVIDYYKDHGNDGSM